MADDKETMEERYFIGTGGKDPGLAKKLNTTREPIKRTVSRVSEKTAQKGPTPCRY
jgi:hypothetical protein